MEQRQLPKRGQLSGNGEPRKRGALQTHLPFDTPVNNLERQAESC